MGRLVVAGHTSVDRREPSVGVPPVIIEEGSPLRSSSGVERTLVGLMESILHIRTVLESENSLVVSPTFAVPMVHHGGELHRPYVLLNRVGPWVKLSLLVDSVAVVIL